MSAAQTRLIYTDRHSLCNKFLWLPYFPSIFSPIFLPYFIYS
uniref:Uncharacterized protein n=1 Tax=Anguilla anguilla TaxID=7936 RepID=A0A0E9P7J1_ANGAN